MRVYRRCVNDEGLKRRSIFLPKVCNLENISQSKDFCFLIFLIIYSAIYTVSWLYLWRWLVPAFTFPHRSGSGSKVNFGYLRKFQLDMNFLGKSYQKMHNLKISTGGPSLVILGFLAVFGKNRVKNAFYGNLALYFIYIYKIWSKYHFSPKYLISIGK